MAERKGNYEVTIVKNDNRLDKLSTIEEVQIWSEVLSERGVSWHSKGEITPESGEIVLVIEDITRTEFRTILNEARAKAKAVHLERGGLPKTPIDYAQDES